VPAFGESRSLAQAEKTLWVLLIHKSGELLKRGDPPESASTDFGGICCGKTAASSLDGAAVFLFGAVPKPQKGLKIM
jgi:hypothetical protein